MRETRCAGRRRVPDEEEKEYETTSSCQGMTDEQRSRQTDRIVSRESRRERKAAGGINGSVVRRSRRPRNARAEEDAPRR